MKKVISHILLLSVVLLSCSKEKDYGVNYEEEHKFFIEGEVDGVPFNMKAGEEGYYLETSYLVDNDLVIMEGRLSKEGEPNKNAIVLRVRSEDDALTTGQFVVNQNVTAKTYSFRDASGFSVQPGKFNLSFYGDTVLSNLDYQWTFPDASISYVQNPVKMVNIGQYTSYPVTMRTSQNGSCHSVCTHYMNLDHDCDATFRMLILSNSKLKTEVVLKNGTYDHAKWYLDGLQVYPDFYSELDLAQAPNAKDLICEVYFKDGCVKRIERNIQATISNPCVTDFWYTKKKPLSYDPNQYSTVELDYYDGNGELYSSYYSQVDGVFNITSTVPYRTNLNGDKTMRFFLETDVTLKNAAGDEVHLSDAFGSFAVAHP